MERRAGSLGLVLLSVILRKGAYSECLKIGASRMRDITSITPAVGRVHRRSSCWSKPCAIPQLRCPRRSRAEQKGEIRSGRDVAGAELD